MRPICIAGKNDIAVNALKYLSKKFSDNKLIVVCNRTDDGVDNWQASLRKCAEGLNVEELNLQDLYAIPDLLFISLEFDRIIDPEKFNDAELYNIHFSVLPKYRGMYTSVWPILNGEKESGVTLHFIDSGIDTGDIIEQKRFAIDSNMTARDLYFKYLATGYELFQEQISNLISGKIDGNKQDLKNGSYYSRHTIDFSNIEIDHNRSAVQVHDQYRAFTFREYQLPKFAGKLIKGTIITDRQSKLAAGNIVDETDSQIEITTQDLNLLLIKD